jgi:Ca2+-binding EF-hand superfamily protein
MKVDAFVSTVLRPLLDDQFGVADRNGNKYVEPPEFPGLDLPGREFDDVDFDVNGEITRAEFDAFIEQELYFSQLQLTASVESEIESLFDQLDIDKDRRLCPRELRAAAVAGGPVATDAAGSTPGSNTGEHTLVFAQSMPRLSSQQFKSERRPGRSSAGRQPVVSAPTEGPLWFRRMDRNQDGDVSWAEFLGTRAAFEGLDRDGDGLIEAREAGSAGS